MSSIPGHLVSATALPSAQDIDVDWLNALITAPDVGRIVAVVAAPVGSGQIGETARLALTYAPGESGPATLIGKFASADPSSRAVAGNWSLYEREVRFYDQLAPRAGVKTPALYGARMDGAGAFVLLLEDLAPDVPGNQFEGLTVPQMHRAIREAARLHTAFPDADADPGLAWLDTGNIAQPFYRPEVLRGAWPGFRDRYADRLEPRHVRVCEALADRYEAYARPPGSPRCVTHNDYRPDNMLLGADRLTVVDWQSVALGWGAADIAYLVGGSCAPDERRAVEADLLRLYHEALREGGSSGYGFAELDNDYRRFTFAGINVAVGAAMLVKRTERGDRLFLTMLDRFVTHVLDRDGLALLDG